MGIKDLFKFLKKFDGGAGEVIPLKNLPAIIKKERGLDEITARMIACDTSLLLFKAVTINEYGWLSIFLNYVLLFMNNGMIPIFILDGAPPEEKEETRQERRDDRELRENKISELNELLDDIARLNINDTSDCPEDILEKVAKSIPKDKCRSIIVTEVSEGTYEESPTGAIVWSEAIEHIRVTIDKKVKQNISPTEEHVETVVRILTALGLQVIQAPGEAEIYSAYLCCHRHVGCVWSDDSDVLCVGSPYIINKLADGKAVLFRHEKLLTSLGITHRMFRDFCIMLKCDYNKRVPGFGPQACWDLITKYKRIEDIPSKPEIPRIGNKVWKPACLKYKKCRLLFRVPREMEMSYLIPEYVNERKLLEVLMENNCNKSLKTFMESYEKMAAPCQFNT